jgi:tetratricopeptide (TPR) repeat protein
MRIRYIALPTLVLIAYVTAIDAKFADEIQQSAKSTQTANSQKPGSQNAASDYSHEPIVYEFVHHVLRYENDGTGTLEYHGRVRVQTSAGLAKAGQLVFDYNAANEKVEVRSVRIEKPDGSIVMAGPESVQDLSAPVAREAPVYTDARQKHVTVPSLSVGDILDYDVVLTSQPVLSGQFWRTEFLMTGYICLDEQVELDIPHDRQIKFANPPGVELAVREAGERRIYDWKRSVLKLAENKAASANVDLTAKRMLEGFRPSLPPHVSFSTFRSWEEVGKWYSELERDRRKPTPEIRAKADEIVRGKASEREKAEALYNWVSANIRYVSLSFGVGRYQPHAAAEVLINRYGDCKDKGTLLEAFFASEGLQAQAALINSAVDLNEDVPSPGQFNHLITYAQVSGENIWLDSTIGVGPFGYLLPQLREKQALVVSESVAPSLRRTADNSLVPAMYRINVEGEVNKDSQLDAKINLETRGDLEVLYRILSSSLSLTQFNAVAPVPIAAGLKATYAAKFTDFVVEDAADISKPLHVQFHFVGDLLYVDMKPSSREVFLVALNTALFQKDGLLSLLPGAQSKYGDAEKLVKPSGMLGGPKEYSLSTTIAVPTVKTDGSVTPQAAHFTSDVAEYDASANWEGSTLHASWKLNLRVPELSDTQTQMYSAFCQSVIGSLNFEVPKDPKTAATASSESASSSTKPTATSADATKSSASGPASSSRDSGSPIGRLHAREVHELYEQGVEEAKRQNYANAAENFNSALKLDPEYPDGWRELGRAQMYLRNYADAESAFRKYLALSPDDNLVYLNMAWALYSEKKYSEEVDLLEKRIASAPSDGDAYARLGSAYLALHQPEKALPVLQKAVSIYPKYEFPQFNLARAHLQLHQEDNAAAAFQRAIVIDGSSNTLNSAAYALAQADTHLEIAASWADRAIQAVETELSQARFPLLSSTMRRVSSLAAYWDTMGWIRFRQGNFDSAESYTRAAAELSGDSTILMHLGRIHEAQARKNDAIEAYAESLASVPTTRELDDDEKEARSRLAILLESDSLIDERVRRSRPKSTERRSVSIPNPTGIEGIVQYAVIVGPGSKLVDIQSLGADDALAELRDTLRSTVMPQSFPGGTGQRLPRTGTLSCPRPELPCTFTFTPAGAASRVVSAD